MNELDSNFYLYLKKMPKVELHAHLNGSLSAITLKKLVDLKKQQSSQFNESLEIPCLKSNNLSECFNLFGLIHKITDSPEAIYIAAQDVIQDFYEDGVLYLELRTTPKGTEAMSPEAYVECVLRAIRDSEDRCKGMKVKLLLSVDRKRSVRDGERTIKIAERLLKESSSVVGIDFSGDPTEGDVRHFLPLLEHAKKSGLQLAVHIAEVSNKDQEVEQLLHLYPSRLGHATFLHPQKGGSATNFEIFKNSPIPIDRKRITMFTLSSDDEFPPCRQGDLFTPAAPKKKRTVVVPTPTESFDINLSEDEVTEKKGASIFAWGPPTSEIHEPPLPALIHKKKKHELQTIVQNKVDLSSYYNKKYVLPYGIESLSYVHHFKLNKSFLLI